MDSKFTYDFGIAIAQSTVTKLVRLTGASLTLAGAFNALKGASNEYVGSLKKNAMYFGGMTKAMQAMNEAQNRLIKGMSFFSMSDQLDGMKRLQTIGIDVGKNLEWINQSAHAIGQDFSQFSDMIADAVSGNMQSMVDAGLLTQRATRMFDKYEANTIMRQQAIMGFLKDHKGLMNAVKDDFTTVQDQARRLQGIWQSFLSNIVGSPKDPSSLYGQLTNAMKEIADSFARNSDRIAEIGKAIGSTLGWIVKNIGKLVTWLGKEFRSIIGYLFGQVDDFGKAMRSISVWLEFWKLRMVKIFKGIYEPLKKILLPIVKITMKLIGWVFEKAVDFLEYLSEHEGLLKTIVYTMLTIKGLQYVFFISKAAIASVRLFISYLKFIPFAMKYHFFNIKTMAMKTFRSIGTMGRRAFVGLSRVARWVGTAFKNGFNGAAKIIRRTGLFMRQAFLRCKAPMRSLVLSAKSFARTMGRAMWSLLKSAGKFAWSMIKTLGLMVAKSFVYMVQMIAANAANPMAWIGLAIAAAILLWKWLKKIFGASEEAGESIDNTTSKANEGEKKPEQATADNMAKQSVKPTPQVVSAEQKAKETERNDMKDLGMNPDDPEQVKEYRAMMQGEDDEMYNDEGWAKYGGKEGANPLMFGTGDEADDFAYENEAMYGGGGGDNITNNFEKGAIQINVQKGDAIDEKKLAKTIEKTINDKSRKENIRKGK